MYSLVSLTCSLGRLLDDNQQDAADLWLINTCTVKNPSQAAMSTLVARGKALDKRLVVCGCVPQGDKKVPELQELSMLGDHCFPCAVHLGPNSSLLANDTRPPTCCT